MSQREKVRAQLPAIVEKLTTLMGDAFDAMEAAGLDIGEAWPSVAITFNGGEDGDFVVRLSIENPEDDIDVDLDDE